MNEVPLAAQPTCEAPDGRARVDDTAPAPAKTRILVAVDFTRESWLALQLSVTLAKAGNAELLLVHVIENALNFPPTGPANVERIRQQLLAEANQRMYWVAQAMYGGDLSIRCIIAEGRPSEQICRLAQTLGTSLIVMGCRPTSKWTRLFHRHTGEELAKRAPCPVLSCTEKSMLGMNSSRQIPGEGSPNWLVFCGV